MTEPNDLQARLDAIRADFIADLPNRAAALLQTWEQVQASGWQDAPLRDLHHLVHSLSGAGATFGCAGLSERARALEEQMQRLQGAVVSGDRERVTALLVDLLAAIAAAADVDR
jgi:chemotaxis protein histidine kinase CheA